MPHKPVIRCGCPKEGSITVGKAAPLNLGECWQRDSVVSPQQTTAPDSWKSEHLGSEEVFWMVPYSVNYSESTTATTAVYLPQHPLHLPQ